MEKLRCQRIGCNATFTSDDNPDGSCIYHDSGPIFHDGMKEWSCCKKRSHDFSLFLEIPGCKTGKHSTEKPLLNKPAPSPRLSISPEMMEKKEASKEACPRCRQGFFCSDHGSKAQSADQKASNGTPSESKSVPHEVPPPPVKKIIDVKQPQICKNKGCGLTFKEMDNHNTACSYHPGPAIFHDRMRGWKCCDVHVKEFDEFMSIPPCTKGWHNADPVS